MRWTVIAVLLIWALPVQAQVDWNFKSAGQWSFSSNTDEMTGEVSHYTRGPLVSPTEPLDFPYRGMKARLNIGCDSDSYWFYFYFTKKPNLTDTSPSGGRDLLHARMKFDDREPINQMLSHRWGTQYVHIVGVLDGDLAKIMALITESSTLLVEMPLYGGSRYFRFPLSGASNAIDKAAQECGVGG